MFRLKPDRTWGELYDRYGFPSRKKRWCNSKCKLRAKKKLKEFLFARGEYLVSYIGFCADEVKRFKYALGARGEKVLQIYPLAEEGIEEKTILEWARTVPIFNGFYRFNTRCGCMLCPAQQLRESAYILKYYPDAWHRMMDLAEKTEAEVSAQYGRPVSVWHGDARYNTAYRRRIVKEKYLPQLEKEIAQWEST